MSIALRTPLDLRLSGARVLWSHWQHEHVQEGYVREFSPDGTHCRITRTPKDTDKGSWFRASDLRCTEALELNFDFTAWNEREKRRQKRSRDEISGDEWKDGDDEGDQ